MPDSEHDYISFKSINRINSISIYSDEFSPRYYRGYPSVQLGAGESFIPYMAMVGIFSQV